MAEELTTAKKHKVFYEDKLNKQVADINEIANQLAFAEAEYQVSVMLLSLRLSMFAQWVFYIPRRSNF